VTSRSSLTRLGAAVIAVGLGLLVLWQAGGLFQAGSATVALDDGGSLALRPADASIETPALAGLSVGLREGDVAPDFEFSAFDGRRMKLSDFRGHPVFLNFWATWCGPCRIEMPEIENSLRRHKDAGLVAIGINNSEAYTPAARYLQKAGVELTAFAYDPAGDIVKRYAVHGMPTSYFVDAQGVITRVSSGQLSAKVMESAVQEAIAGSAARGR